MVGGEDVDVVLDVALRVDPLPAQNGARIAGQSDAEEAGMRVVERQQGTRACTGGAKEVYTGILGLRSEDGRKRGMADVLVELKEGRLEHFLDV